MSKNWYVLKVRAGSEKKAKISVIKMLELNGWQDKLEECMLITQEVVEKKNGKNKTTIVNLFPGYLVIKLDINYESICYHIEALPLVVHFIGGSRDKQGRRVGMPVPLSSTDIDHIKDNIQQVGVTKHKVVYENGQSVRIKEGPFVDFKGTVEEVNYDKNKVKLSVLIFGRSTLVEFDFSQVESAI